jgi:ssDNA-binding Zn-finger/Zn-ribbon topoisomerase 1
MNTGKAIRLGVAVVALVGAVWLTVRWARQGRHQYEDFPEGTFWVCTNPECGHEFTLPLAEVAAFYDANPEADLKCPKCGQPAVRAARCPFCGRLFPRGSRGNRPRVCPHCERELPRATDFGD